MWLNVFFDLCKRKKKSHCTLVTKGLDSTNSSNGQVIIHQNASLPCKPTPPPRPSPPLYTRLK